MILPLQYGRDTMSANARDLVRIVAWTLDDEEARHFLFEIYYATARHTSQKTNVVTVERVLQRLYGRFA